MNRLKPVHVDGILYVLIAVSGAAVVTFSDNDMFKYLNVYFVIYGKIIAQWTLAGSTALKTYRSGTYSQFKSEQQSQSGNGHAAEPPKPVA